MPGRSMPRVSIVTPVYNDEEFVEEMIASVRSQTFGDWEHVLVDDGSTDRSVELIQIQQNEEPRLKLVTQANAGASVARNVGYAATTSSSEYLLFLDHDDVLEPQMLATMVAYLDRHPDVGVAYCRFLLIDKDGNRTAHTWDVRFRAGTLKVGRVPDAEPETPFETLLMWGGILPSNAVIRRSLFDSVGGGFDPKYFNDDTDLFMRLGLVAPIHRVSQPLLLYRRHASQMSGDADLTSASLDHLLAEKWEPSDLSPQDRRRFERGMNLRQYGAHVPGGIDHGLGRVRSGEFARGTRFLVGAMRRELLYVAANLGLIRRKRTSMGGAPRPARAVSTAASRGRARVAIVTPFRNAGLYIGAMLESVRAQTLVDWEHVLIDDGSEDDSLRIAQEAADRDTRIRVFSQANAGVSASRNVGARHSSGLDYLLFLDSDDVLEPKMLATLVAYMDAHPEAGVGYCSFSVIAQDLWHEAPVPNVRYSPRTFSVRRLAPRQTRTPFETLPMWGGILPSNALIRRTAFEQSGGFDERYAAAEDTDLFMRLGLHAEVHYVDEPLMRYRRHGSQASWDADATSRALDKLLAEKWAAAPMPRPQRKRVERALNLRRYGASALEGFRFGTDRMRAGNVTEGLRFYGGAARRYVLYCAANLSSLIGSGAFE